MPSYVRQIVLVAFVLGVYFWGVKNGKDSVNAERTEQAEETVEQRNEAEKVIVQERIVYRDRIQKIREVVTDCAIPPDILRVLADAGIYVGPL